MIVKKILLFNKKESIIIKKEKNFIIFDKILSYLILQNNDL